MPFINFEEVEQLATIEQLADMLGLKAKQSGRQLRCVCPIHGGDDRTLAITPDVRSKRGSEGVFFCQKSKSGGDRIGLVAHCMDIGQQDAAFFIAEQYSNSKGTVDSTVCKERATVPQKTEGGKQPAPIFDPLKFWPTLAYTDEVAALGISEVDAARLWVGAKRGKIYQALRDEFGFVAGFSEYKDGAWKFPAKLLESPARNVVKLRA